MREEGRGWRERGEGGEGGGRGGGEGGGGEGGEGGRREGRGRGERRGREEGRETGRERLLLATMLSRYINNPITGLTERASCRW